MCDRKFCNAVIIAGLLFFATLVAGYAGAIYNPAIGQNAIAFFKENVGSGVIKESPGEMFGYILANNLGACIALFLGGASFGIATLCILSLNGGIIGAVIAALQKEHSAAFLAAGLLPHGIFEIPAFIIAGALGIHLAQSLVMEWYGEGNAAEAARKLSRKFIFIVLPLVITAAFVEAFITPLALHVVS
jgi:stage II sporulation protein M